MYMNKQNKKQNGFSLVIASLALDEQLIMDDLGLPEQRTFSLPINANFFLWQAFHLDVKNPGKNKTACMKYVEERFAWLSKKYANVNKEKNKGLILQSSSSEFIVRDICLPLLSGIDEDRVLEISKPIFDAIDYVVFIDRQLSSKSVQKSQCFLGRKNLDAIRSKMLYLSKKMGWKVISLQNKEFQKQDLEEIKRFCNL